MSKQPTKEEREYWAKLADLGCIVNGCRRRASIHHCGTGAGGRKNHSKVIPLCHKHHQGDEGIHTIGRKLWQIIYGTEEYLMNKAREMINEIWK